MNICDIFTIFLLKTLVYAQNIETFPSVSLIHLSAMLNRALQRAYYVGDKCQKGSI